MSGSAIAGSICVIALAIAPGVALGKTEPAAPTTTPAAQPPAAAPSPPPAAPAPAPTAATTPAATAATTPAPTTTAEAQVEAMAPVAAPTAAQPPPAQIQQKEARPALPRRSASAGVGLMSMSDAARRKDSIAFSLSADWRPMTDRMWGLRAHYVYGAFDDGTDLVRSSRSSHLLSVLATRHLRVANSVHVFGGLGLGAAAIHTSHSIDDDTRTGTVFKPAWSWTTGMEVPYARLVLRIDVTGVVHQVSHDRLYALRLGARF